MQTTAHTPAPEGARRFAVVTTCHAAGYERYGRAMVESYLAHWPAQVPLQLYAEGFVPPVAPGRIVGLDLADASPGLVAFKRRHAGHAGATGALRPGWRLGGRTLRVPVLRRRERYRWDAVRFAHKCFAVFDAARRSDADVLVWIDADTLFFADVSLPLLESLVPADCAVACLRRPRYTECGFVAYNLRHAETRRLLDELEAMYLDDLLFAEREFHDSWLFDVVRLRAEARGARIHDIAEGAGARASHVLVNSRLGAFMDHLKGARKDNGASRARDLVVERTEGYWQRLS